MKEIGNILGDDDDDDDEYADYGEEEESEHDEFWHSCSIMNSMTMMGWRKKASMNCESWK